MKQQEKPDWITDEQWATVPNVQWWEDVEKGKQYIANSKPHTIEEARAQFERLRNDKNWR